MTFPDGGLGAAEIVDDCEGRRSIRRILFKAALCCPRCYTSSLTAQVADEGLFQKLLGIIVLVVLRAPPCLRFSAFTRTQQCVMPGV